MFAKKAIDKLDKSIETTYDDEQARSINKLGNVYELMAHIENLKGNPGAATVYLQRAYEVAVTFLGEESNVALYFGIKLKNTSKTVKERRKVLTNSGKVTVEDFNKEEIKGENESILFNVKITQTFEPFVIEIYERATGKFMKNIYIKKDSLCKYLHGVSLEEIYNHEVIA